MTDIQTLPGVAVVESSHTLTFLTGSDREEAAVLALAAAQFKALQDVIGAEDLAVAFGQQEALATGLHKHVLFGRNEVANQHYHRCVDHAICA